MELNILVTGGAGFIGSHLSTFLIKNNHKITIVDSFHSYYSVKRKQEQLNEVESTGAFTFIELDLLDEQNCLQMMKKGQYDIVIHLAALPGVSYSIEKPLAYVDYDIKATINVLKAAGESGVKKVIFASSSSVYGDIQGRPLQEQLATGKVVSPYAASKYGAESFCHAYQSLYGFQLVILRFFTVYGPWGRPDMAIPKFINKLLKGEELEIYGQDTARDYTYIDDIVHGIYGAVHSQKESEVYNLGAGKSIPMKQLLSIFTRYFPTIKVKQMPHRQGDVTATWADITKAKQDLGYEPTVNIEEGLKRTIEWAKSYHLP